MQNLESEAYIIRHGGGSSVSQGTRCKRFYPTLRFYIGQHNVLFLQSLNFLYDIRKKQ